jgi:hypothetical protein
MDVGVISYQTGATAGGGLPTESLALKFSDFKASYTPQSKSGEPGESEPSYDITPGKCN